MPCMCISPLPLASCCSASGLMGTGTPSARKPVASARSGANNAAGVATGIAVAAGTTGPEIGIATCTPFAGCTPFATIGAGNIAGQSLDDPTQRLLAA